MSMHVSQIYARFSPQVDLLFRRAMALASRHRVVRVHHVVAAEAGQAEVSEKSDAGQTAVCLPAEWIRQAGASVEQDPAGSLDSPMSNSPTMRRVLLLACERAGGDLILPSHLVAIALCCWGEERPPGQADGRQIGEFCRSLGVRPLPAFEFAVPAATPPSITDRDDSVSIPAPTVEELEAMIGPAVTTDDLINLYMQMRAATDPAHRDRLARKLSYLRDHG